MTILTDKPPMMTAAQRYAYVHRARYVYARLARRVNVLIERSDNARSAQEYIETVAEIEETAQEMALCSAWVLHDNLRKKEEAK